MIKPSLENGGIILCRYQGLKLCTTYFCYMSINWAQLALKCLLNFFYPLSSVIY